MDDLADEPDEAWTLEAACTGCDPDLFFAHVGDKNAVSEARKVCAGCPVNEECLEYAIRTNQRHGIWAGTTPKERRKVRAVERLRIGRARW